ncbi:class I SAM-dependent methyltransferase [Alteribacillus sp. YIM 98480]|uniref:class I SAM-dependent methyltransferase n=1 Tax=Alteribacillus sp. YIM 98480 TaxID=2606599 RepID=UPI00131AC967|nr:class I SAM-dependent methyltransferase [Alteribacillus sp. YIM 98480]
MILPGILPYVRELVDRCLKEGEIAIDATAGNGMDTLYLAKKVGTSGKVYSFDIQQAAIEKTNIRLKDHQLDNRVSLILDSHVNAASYLADEEHFLLKAAVFNLGYLPSGDKTITTKGDTTVQAVSNLLQIMPSRSIIILVIYHGHEEGKKEKQTIETFVKQLNQTSVNVLRYEFINQINNPPFIIAIEKK